MRVDQLQWATVTDPRIELDAQKPGAADGRWALAPGAR